MVRRFRTVGGTSTMLISADNGATWTAETSQFAGFRAIVRTPKGYVAGGSNGAIATLSQPVTTKAVAEQTLLAGSPATPFTPVTAAGAVPPYGFSVTPSLPADLLVNSSTGTISGTPAAASFVPAFVGSDSFSTQSLDQWAYVYRLSGSNGEITPPSSAGRLEFTKATGAGTRFLGWDGDRSSSASRTTASYHTSWRAEVTVGNSLAPTTANEYAAAGLQIAAGSDAWAVLAISTFNGSIVVRGASVGVAQPVTKSLNSGVGVRLRMEWDATSQTLVGSYSTNNGVSYDQLTTFPVSAWPAGFAPRGFYFELFGDSSMASSIPAGALWLDDFRLEARSAAATMHTVTVTDAVGVSASSSFLLTVNPPVPVIGGETSVTATAGVSFSYPITATNSPNQFGATGLPGGLSLDPSTGVISGTPTTVGNSIVTVTAKNFGGTSTAVSLNLNVVPRPQVLSFTPPVTKTYGDAAFPVQATSDSGLPVTITVGSGPASISDGTVSLTGVGTVVLRASQIGDLTRAPAFLEKSITVLPRPVTVTAAPQTKVYGAPDPALTYAITSGSLVGTDKVSGALTRAPGETVAAGPYNILQGTLSAGNNYSITFVGSTLAISKAPLIAKPEDKTKTVGADNPPLTIAYSGFAPGESKSVISEPAISTTAVKNSPVGPYDIVLSGGSAANYELTLQKGTLSVVDKLVPVIDWAPTGPIVYGTALGAGQLNATAKTPGGASLQGTFVYTPASGAFLNAGNQTLSVTFTPTDGVQYASTTVTKPVTVNPRPLALALKGTVTKAYNGSTGAALSQANYDLTGFFGTENAIVNKTAGVYDNAAVGTGKTVGVTSLSAQDFSPGQGTILSNYTLPTSASGQIGEISRKAISAVVQGSVSKTYDGTTKAALTASNYMLDGFVNGESATVNQTAAAFDTAAAGTGKMVTATLSAGNFVVGANTLLSNYELPLTAVGAVGVIEKKQVTGSFTAVNEVYDGKVEAYIAQTSVNGAIQGDDVSLSGGTATYGSATAGNGKTVTLSGASLSGTKASNYTLSSVATATANITPKQLTVTGLSAGNKSYDGSATAVLSGNASLLGVIDGDDVSLAGTASAVFANSNGGIGKAVTVSGLSLNGAAKDNYSLAPVSLTADIAKVPLTVKAEDRSKGYDGQVFASGGHAVTYAGFILGETASVLGGSLIYGGAAATALNVGQHAITPAGLTSANYAITFLDGKLSITPRTLIIQAKDDSKVYGTAKTYGTSIAFTSQGLVTGQSIGSVTITPSGGATAASPVGTYDLVPTAASGGTFLASNYDITYLKGTLTVSAFSVTGSFVAANKTYDGTTTALASNLSLIGARSGDVVSLVGGTAVFQTAGVGNAKRVDLNGATLTGANSGNYVLVGVDPAFANITPNALTVSGLSAVNKTYDGTAVATLSGTAVLQGKVDNEDVTLTGTPVGAFANAGAGSSKPVNITGLSLSGAAAGNYTLTPPTLTANITKADQTLTIVSVLKRAVTDPDFTIDVAASSKLTNFTYAISNSAVANISSTGVIDLLTQGTTTITVTQLGHNNFNSASVTGDLSVVASGQTLVWDSSVLNGKKFGDAPITLSATASSNLPVTFTSSNLAVAEITGNTLRSSRKKGHDGRREGRGHRHANRARRHLQRLPEAGHSRDQPLRAEGESPLRCGPRVRHRSDERRVVRGLGHDRRQQLLGRRFHQDARDRQGGSSDHLRRARNQVG